MKKADELNLAFGNCFSRSRLTPKQCDLLSVLSLQELMTKHLFNENQSRQILSWCQIQCQINQNSFYSEEREEANDPDMHYYRT